MQVKRTLCVSQGDPALFNVLALSVFTWKLLRNISGPEVHAFEPMVKAIPCHAFPL